MSNEQLALVLDPERKRAGWWDWHGQHYGSVRLKMALYTGPPLATDDLAAFTYLRPVLLAMGCTINQHRIRTVVYGLKEGVDEFKSYWERQKLACLDDYAPACAAAIAWLAANDAQRLANAVGEVWE